MSVLEGTRLPPVTNVPQPIAWRMADSAVLIALSSVHAGLQSANPWKINRLEPRLADTSVAACASLEDAVERPGYRVILHE
jgi:hypothetical protein